MSLFGGLYVGKSGLQTSQNALNTVAHNLSNQNTTGYVRQQVAMTDTYYNTISTTKAISNSQTGDGVRYSEVRHIRDYFLDMKYQATVPICLCWYPRHPASYRMPRLYISLLLNIRTI